MYKGKQINLMWAMDEARLIGNNNSLPWDSITEDMAYFRNTTTPHPLVIGRNTWDSIPKQYRPLKGRQNIVISRNPSLSVPDNVLVAGNMEDALDKANDSTIFIIGGAEIYRLALPYADKLYITKIHRRFQGNIYFPTYNTLEWQLDISRSLIVGPVGAKFTIDFSVYSRISKSHTTLS